MGLANEMKSLSEEMLASFKERVKDNEELVVNVEKKLQQYRDEQNKRAENISIDAAELKKNMEEGEKERVKEYDQLISIIRKDIKDIEEDVMSSKSATNTLISDFTKSRKVLAEELDKQLSEEHEKRLKNEQIRIAEYEIYITKISDEVSGIFKYTNEMLAKFGSEHKEMSDELKAELMKARKERFEHTQELIQSIQGRINDISNENRTAALKLRKDLEEGDAERLKAFNGLFERISSEVEQLRKSTTELLGSYSDDRAQGAKHWAEMQEKIAAIRAGEKENEIEITVPEKKNKEVKPEPEIATVKVMPVIEEKPPVVVVEIPVEKEQITLEERILQYINSHIEGVKVSDMEEPLHETRMKIGFAAKCLLDAGKVSKVENLYYPVKKINK